MIIITRRNFYLIGFLLSHSLPLIFAAGSQKINRSDVEWKKHLSPQQFYVLRNKGTERAFSGKYWNHHGKGIYRCAGCGNDLFSSETKFESGTGWPSFWSPMDKNSITEKIDNGFGMERVEVLCSRCGSHLGHVFADGPKPTGLRYCINSICLEFSSK